MPTPKKVQLPPLDWSRENVGEKIAGARKKQGLTQNDLAQRIGITQNMVSDYEIGRSHLSDEMIVRFASALNLSTDELLGLKKQRQKNGSADDIDLKFARRIKRIRALSPSEQKHILRTLDSLIRDAETRSS